MDQCLGLFLFFISSALNLLFACDIFFMLLFHQFFWKVLFWYFGLYVGVSVWYLRPLGFCFVILRIVFPVILFILIAVVIVVFTLLMLHYRGGWKVYDLFIFMGQTISILRHQWKYFFCHQCWKNWL